MTYVMSDVHGQLEKFETMLAQINFNKTDRLYVLGDVIDRGEHGVEILTRIASTPNMTLLLGNHELMCLQAMRRNERVRDVWLDGANGGRPTLKALLDLSQDRVDFLLNIIESAPETLDVEAGGRKFRLVHGGPGDTQYERLWCRPSPLKSYRRMGHTLIVGHTPTCNFWPNPWRYLSRVEHMEIFYCEGFIGIDCGCACIGTVPGGCLGCLRLDDMTEFYA